MELTLTGGSTLSDHSRASTPVHSNSNDKVNQDNHSHNHNHNNHNHGHSHNHNTHGGNCCNPRQPRPTPKIDASTLLPSKEVVQRFKTDQKFRLNVLSNVIRGGPYELFTNLVAVLVLDTSGTIVTTDEARDDEAVIKGANPASLAQLLDGFGADGHTLTHWCAKRGADPRFLSFLIERSYVGAQLLLDLHLPSKDSVGMYPLHWAVTEGAIPLVSMLLQHLEDRPSPTQRTSSSSTTSPSSLMQDEDELAESNNTNNLSNVGIDAKDSSGCTPLLIASQYGHPDLAAFLIQRGANPSAVDGSRDTALHWAAYKGSVEVCGMLLHLLGVEGLLDAQDAFGQSPLHLASLRGNADTVRFLMEEAGSLGERSGGLESAVVGRVGSKTNKSNRASFFYPGKLLSMMDKEDKTPRDLAIKKKKLGCELLLQEYEELYVQPKRSFFSRLGRTFKDLCSIRSWKTWMGMGGGDLTIDQSLTFPFYWMTLHILLAGLFYATEFVGIGGRRSAVDNTLLLDKSGLHLFYVVAWIATWWNLYKVYKTNPGVLDARGENKISAAPATCQLICCSSRGGYPKDKVSMEMDSVTKELRRQYDDIIESYSRNFPSEEKRVPLCHTCRIVKPMRSKHCRVARRCVLVFDHHCPFVGTTIGLYNYVYFYLFLLSFCTMACAFITAWIMFLTRSKLFPKATFMMGGYFAIYLIPVMAMAFYHTTLVLSNSSTNEQMNARKYRYFWDESGRFNNPFNHGKIRNILQRCWPDRSSYELVRPGGSCCGGQIEMTNEEEEREPMLSNIV